METLALEFDALLRRSVEPPCLSLYQPTHRHHPSNQQDPIRFKNLLARLEQLVKQGYPGYNPEDVLKPLRELADDSRFWDRTLDGLAVLAAPGLFRCYRLQRSVPTQVFAADTFHLKPLIRTLQSADRYQVLALTMHSARLFEGNRDALDEISSADEMPRTIQDALGSELTEPYLTGTSRSGSGAAMYHGHGSRSDERNSDTERFFRAVDRAVWINHSRPSGLPLFLAALKEHHAVFRRVSRNPALVDTAITVDPKSVDRNTLRDLAWEAEKPRYLAYTDELVDRFRTAQRNGLASDELAQIAVAAAGARIEAVIVEADHHVTGRLDPVTGHMEVSDAPDVDDLLDDVGELVLKRGGRTVVVPRDRMPTRSPIAAIYRY
jgi:hypothetical protein